VEEVEVDHFATGGVGNDIRQSLLLLTNKNGDHSSTTQA